MILHIVHRFDTGGLENGIVNLLNHLPSDRYRHGILALTEVTSFRDRVARNDVIYISMKKPAGHGFWLYRRIYDILKEHRPFIVHTRNLAALEMQVAAWAAGTPVRIHGEHGRDAQDPDGLRRRYQWLRRAYRPFVNRYVTVSRDLETYLHDRVGIPDARIERIYNGVDVERFRSGTSRTPIAGCPFADPAFWLVGTVGRMSAVKNQPLLARAFARAIALAPTLRSTLRLIMVGEGPLREESLRILTEAGLADLAWLPGERDDVPEIMRGLNCFVLPSLGEGISNTILEAMATALPVIATNVGGNGDLVNHGVTGNIVPSGDVEALAASILAMAQNPDRATAMGLAGRAEVGRRFSLQAMVTAYDDLYRRSLAEAKRQPRSP